MTTTPMKTTMTNDCKTCPLSTGTHKPAEALHQQIDEPALQALRERMQFTHARLGHAERFVEAPAAVVAEVIKLSDRQHARIAELESQLDAIGAGGVEPLRKPAAAPKAGKPLRDLALGVTSFLDHAGFDTSHLPSGMGAALRRLRDAAIATQPAAQGMDADGMYYLQDARHHAMVGNCPSFWRPDGNGYTTNLDEAARFTFEDAMQQHQRRKTDLPWLCSEVDKLRRPTVDFQDMPRSWDAQRAALAAQAKQGGADHG